MAVWIRPVFALEHLSPLYTCGCYRTSHSAVRVPRGDRGNDDVVRATVLLVLLWRLKESCAG
uniref:Uncharacterized protein n=1 Tax=Timema cristinae TaxID=61476 RepID=A0A7R9D3U3_TIMCR|nr:unnamed protein product [Timema cristinae]